VRHALACPVDPKKTRSEEAASKDTVFGVTLSGERRIRWDAAGRAVSVYHPEGLPIQISRIDLAAGKREVVREYLPANPLGVYSVCALVLSADSRMAVYGFQRITSELFLADGLK